MKNKKLNNAGFTLIELLAVITIMGILMMVAIPSVSRTIENSRRDTFANTALQYLTSIKNSVAADELSCNSKTFSANGSGYYYVAFNSTLNSGTDLLESGGKSSWGSAEVVGVIVINKTVDDSNRTKYTYGVAMMDSAGRGFGTVSSSATSSAINKVLLESDVKRANVNTKDGDGRATYASSLTGASGSDPVIATSWYYGTTSVTTGAPTKCSIDM